MRTVVLSSFAALSILAVGACTTPQPQQASAPKAVPAAARTATAGAAKICTSRVVTGSLMPVRECHTPEEWAEIKQHGQDSLGIQAQRHLPSNGSN
jgi:hypothetical protein